jgi:hypothetical protein
MFIMWPLAILGWLCVSTQAFSGMDIQADAQVRYIPDEAISQAVLSLRQRGQSDPHGAIDGLVELIHTLPVDSPDAFLAFDAMGDLASMAKRHTEELAARQRGLHFRVAHPELRISGHERLKAYVGLAQALKDHRRYKDAIDVVNEGMNVLQHRGSAEMLAVLWKMRAVLADCNADHEDAFKSMVKGLKLESNASLSISDNQYADNLMLQLRILGNAIHSMDHPSDLKQVMPFGATLQAGIRSKHTDVVNELLGSGIWQLPTQLPRNYVQGLRAKPIWDVSVDLPTFLPVIRAMQAATADIRSDYLNALHNRLREETECIHTSKSGDWKVFTVNGIENQDLDVDGCSSEALAACALLKQISSMNIPGVRVLRGGYSAINRNGHLRPHFGITNAQLKFHLGLIVPTAPDGNACASIRVASETAAWKEGDVLVFDDSFEHEVTSTCESPRVIFQLVLAHPEHVASGAAGPFGRSQGGAPH